jgi:hypothetical protein
MLKITRADVFPSCGGGIKYLDVSTEANGRPIRHGQDDVVDVAGVVCAAVASLSIALGVTTTVVFHLTCGHLQTFLDYDKNDGHFRSQMCSVNIYIYSERDGFPFFGIEG